MKLDTLYPVGLDTLFCTPACNFFFFFFKVLECQMWLYQSCTQCMFSCFLLQLLGFFPERIPLEEQYYKYIIDNLSAS